MLDSLELVEEATALDSEVLDLPSAVARMRKACSSLCSGEGLRLVPRKADRETAGVIC